MWSTVDAVYCVLQWLWNRQCVMRNIMNGNDTDRRTDGSPPPFGGTIVVTAQGNRRTGIGSWGCPPVAGARLAPHIEWGGEELALPSSTKPTLCSNPRVVALGHRGDKRLSNKPGTITTACRSLGPSRRLLAAVTSASTSRYLTEMWMPKIWYGSLNKCIATTAEDYSRLGPSGSTSSSCQVASRQARQTAHH